MMIQIYTQIFFLPFYRIWFFIFCRLDPLLQDPVLLFCYGGPCKVNCFLKVSCLLKTLQRPAPKHRPANLLIECLIQCS